jgi:type I restriction enzyme S subunit
MSKEKLIPEFRFPEFKGEWSLEELGQCLDYLQPTPFLVDNTDYNDEYEIPVLTAGKSFILGYTNEQEGIFNENLPVIIFDDFTTASQFVDFPFKTKSSAMKILLAKNGNDIKFVYESMQTLNYEVGVHKRHWISVFSKLRIAVPKPQEQQKIASCLSSLDELIAAHKDKLDALKDHKKGLLQNLFPQEGETVPKVRFPEFEGDGEWELKPFSKFIKLYRGSSPRPIREFLTEDETGVNWIKIGDTSSITDFVIRSVSEKITLKGAEKSRRVKKGELILANSMSYGSTYLLEVEGCIYDGWFVLREYEQYFDKEFLLQLLNSEYTQGQYKKYAAGGIVQNISSEIVYSITLPKTSKEEQQKIASCLSAVDELITAQQEKIEQLQQHKKGLMQGLFPKIES